METGHYTELGLKHGVLRGLEAPRRRHPLLKVGRPGHLNLLDQQPEVPCGQLDVARLFR